MRCSVVDAMRSLKPITTHANTSYRSMSTCSQTHAAARDFITHHSSHSKLTCAYHTTINHHTRSLPSMNYPTQHSYHPISPHYHHHPTNRTSITSLIPISALTATTAFQYQHTHTHISKQAHTSCAISYRAATHTLTNRAEPILHPHRKKPTNPHISLTHRLLTLSTTPSHKAATELSDHTDIETTSPRSARSFKFITSERLAILIKPLDHIPTITETTEKYVRSTHHLVCTHRIQHTSRASHPPPTKLGTP